MSETANDKSIRVQVLYLVDVPQFTIYRPMTLLALCDGWRKMLPRDDNGLLITGYVGQSSDDYNDEWLHCILVDFEKEQFFCHNLVRFVKF